MPGSPPGPAGLDSCWWPPLVQLEREAGRPSEAVPFARGPAGEGRASRHDRTAPRPGQMAGGAGCASEPGEGLACWQRTGRRWGSRGQTQTHR